MQTGHYPQLYDFLQQKKKENTSLQSRGCLLKLFWNEEEAAWVGVARDSLMRPHPIPSQTGLGKKTKVFRAFLVDSSGEIKMLEITIALIFFFFLYLLFFISHAAVVVVEWVRSRTSKA